MATAVVSGRVDERVRQRADAYIKAAGLTPADVIRVVWENIARTGEVPDEGEAQGETPDAFEDFMAFRASLPKATWLADLTDEQMKDMIASRCA